MAGAGDDPDSRLWQEAIALFEQLRELNDDQAAQALAAAPPGVAERVRRMQRAESGSGPLDQRLPDAHAPEQLGRWRIGPVLGRGGMSVVYRARSTVAPEDQVAAVKLLALPAPGNEARARFAREIDILAKLRHPGIAPLYDAGVAPDGRPWFAMALVDGEAIDAWSVRTQPGVRAIVERVATLADAVAHAHRHLVVHRDIKPGNVMVDADGGVVLLDFGISRVLEEGASELTSGGSYPLTPRYAAPEQRRGGPVSTATDVYGLGALLHTLLLRAPPVLPERADTVVLPSACELPADLQAVMRQALAREPGHRYAGAAELAADLRAWLEERAVKAHRGGTGYRVRRWLARNPGVTGLAAALVLSLLVGTGVSLWQADQARSQARAADAARREAETSRQAAERERDRARALNDFVLGLFSAQLPNRPRDQLPTTAELLETGVQKARDPASGAPALRAQVLSAIANVHQARGRPDLAKDLIGEAIVLARQDQALAPEILVEALRRQAGFAMGRGDFALADSALSEAESVQQTVEGGGPPGAALLGLRRTRAMAAAARHDFDTALALFEAIARDVRGREDLPATLAARASSDLAVIYSSVGRYADAVPHSDAAVRRMRESGKRDVGAAATLSNNGRLRMFLGDFTGARERMDEALSLYDALFDAPNAYRAAARYNLGRLLAYQGDFDAALGVMDQASEESALADGRDPANDTFAPLNRAEVLMAARRWTDVVAEGQRGHQRLLAQEQAEAYADSLLQVEAHLAIALCRLGRPQDGLPWLDLARIRLASGAWPDRSRPLLVSEAEAECRLAGGDPEGARAALADLRAGARHVAPGEVPVHTRRNELAQRLAGHPTP